MKIKTLKFCLFLFAITIVFVSCDEDDAPTVDFELRDRTEQQIADKDSLDNYLSTHYYNSGFFETGTNHRFTDIIITELLEGEDVPVGHTLLIDAVGSPLTTEYLDTTYEYYVLRLNQGGGDAPKFTDQVRVAYEGISINTDESFDYRVTPEELNLQGNGFTTSGVIKAWQLILPTFNAAFDFTNGTDGIVNYNNYGMGVMFVPSGLAYFAGTNTGTSYDNLMFKFELLQFEEVDHDNDGIPSYIEDLDGNLEVNDDDTNDDNFPNYVDIDDDGDDVFTIDELMPKEYIVDTNMGEEEPILGDDEYEISRGENNGIITINTVTIVDSNNDGIPDYLDETITINYNETNS